jgi:hypothetical protein
MADETRSPHDPLSPAERAQVESVIALLRAATDTEAVRLAAAELERISRGDQSTGAVPTPPAIDVRLSFLTEEELPSAADAEGDDDAERMARRALEGLGPDLAGRLLEVQGAILRRIEEDPEWAMEFALTPLDALARLDPPMDAELLEALRRQGGGPVGALTGDATVRVVEAGRGRPERRGGRLDH